MSTATLLAYGLLALSVRWVADDYSNAAAVAQTGWWHAQVAEYLGWGGRVTASAAIMGTVALGEWTAPLVPLAIIALWGLAVYFLLSSLSERLRICASRPTLLLTSQGILAATLAFAPDLFESVFWTTGALTYALPLVAGTTLAAVLVRPSPGKRSWQYVRIAAVGILALLAGGCSDTYVAIQSALLGVVLIGLVARRRERRTAGLGAVAAALGGSLGALAVVVLAPGNAVREAHFPPHAAMTSVAHTAVIGGVQLLAANIGAHFAGLAVAFVVGITAAAQMHRDWHPPRLTFYACSVMALGSWITTAGISFWATGGAPPGRSLLPAAYITIGAAGWVGFGAGLVLRAAGLRARGTVMLTGLCGALLSTLMLGAAGSWPAMRAYAATKDSQSVMLRQAWSAGANLASVSGVDTMSLGVLAFDPAEELSDNPRYWVNATYADYFGIPTVVAHGGSTAHIGVG